MKETVRATVIDGGSSSSSGRGTIVGVAVVDSVRRPIRLRC